MAIHSSILYFSVLPEKIPSAEEPSGLQPPGSQRVSPELSFLICTMRVIIGL